MNASVTVSGMQAKTAVSNNLLIDDYTGGSWATNDSTFKSALTQTINTNNVLAPLSTINGKNFYYVDPSNVAGDGDAVSNAYLELTTLASLQEKYPEATGTYLDYHFVLKAENTSPSASAYINLTKCNLIYSGASDSNVAFRVAAFADEFTTATVNGAKTAPGMIAAAKTILVPGTAANYYESGKAVSSTSATGSVLTLNTAANLATVAANTTKYYEVTIRLWLEGEDKTCTVGVFKDLAAGNWQLNLKIDLANTTGGVESLSKYTSAEVSSTMYYYDGTYVWTNVNNLGDASDDRQAISSASSAIQEAFGYDG